MTFDSRFSIFKCRRLFAPALAALFLVGFAHAEPAATPSSKIENRKSKIAAPLLWKIASTADGAADSWLFGTIHLSRPELTTLPSRVREALDGADAVYTEIPADLPTMVALVPKMMLPDGATVDSVVGSENAAALEAAIQAINPALSLQPFSRFKPWAVIASILQLEDQMKYPGALALDMLLYQRAATAGKEVGGIETVDEQIAIFDSFTNAEHILMVEDTLRQLRALRDSKRSLSDQLTVLYLTGDLDHLVAELEKMESITDNPELTARFKDRLLYRRNDLMAERMAKRLRARPGTSYFFAVGAAHLQGPRGLIAALEKAGFTLSRVQ